MFCPRCGSGSLQQRSEKEFACGCGFHYFQNVASAVMVALCWQDELLVAVRARDPGRACWICRAASSIQANRWRKPW